MWKILWSINANRYVNTGRCIRKLWQEIDRSIWNLSSVLSLAPRLACLKKTEVQLELMTDADMLLMVAKGIRPVMCLLIHQYAKANKKHLKEYDANKDSSYRRVAKEVCWVCVALFLLWKPLNTKCLLEYFLVEIKTIQCTSGTRLARAPLVSFSNPIYKIALYNSQTVFFVKIIWKLNRSVISIIIVSRNNLIRKKQGAISQYMFQCISVFLSRPSIRLLNRIFVMSQ